MVYYFHLTKAPGAAAALALFAGGVSHALVIDPGPDPGRSHRRVLDTEPGKYGPGQPAVEEKHAQALTVQLVRVCKTSAGKGGVLEHCDIGAHLGRRLVPLWLTAGGFSLLLAAFIRL